MEILQLITPAKYMVILYELLLIVYLQTTNQLDEPALKHQSSYHHTFQKADESKDL